MHNDDSFVRIDGINTHIWRVGIGIPVVLLHGFMGTVYDWRFNVPELGKHFAVNVFELPGFGYSDKPLDFTYTSQGYAEFVKTYLDTCNIEKAVLVGNSMGGQIALQTYFTYSDRVSALILIDSGGYPGSVHFLLFRLLKMRLIGNVIMSLITRSSVRLVLKEIIKDGSFVTDDAVNYYYKVYQTANSRRIPHIVVTNMINDETNIYSNLNEIKCPTSIVWGAQDNVIPPIYAGLLGKNILNASVVMVPDAGHMPQVEKAEVVNDTMVSFISRLPVTFK